jgi:hypothetical protein
MKPMPTLAPPRYCLDLVESEKQLKELHKLDAAAYGSTALDFERFRQWWLTYDLGLRVVLQGDRIVGAIGVWALDEENIRLFISGQLKESQLAPMRHEQLEEGSRFWYVSGILIEPGLRLKMNSPLKLLLDAGIGGIFTSGKVRYPTHVYALGYTNEGMGLLEKLHFQSIKPGIEMADHCPLYWKQLTCKEDLWSGR